MEIPNILKTMSYSEVLELSPQDNNRLLTLCGKLNENLNLIARRLNVQIKQRGYRFCIDGEAKAVGTAIDVLNNLYATTIEQKIISLEHIHLYLQTLKNYPETKLNGNTMQINIRRGPIAARGENQMRYMKNILENDINFGIGPAGTGKTYIAVACAVQALETDRISRIILVRPIVEAGEKLGFLPGDLAQKVHPYLRPLYDALYEMIGFEKVHQLIEHDIIELVPLAYMRGRSLNDSFIILDEGQNTTLEQMKMFLTRIGFNSKAVITGDITQIDLSHRRDSGLINALEVLNNVKGISFTQFQPSDVVRHPLVQSIVEAYEKYTEKKGS